MATNRERLDTLENSMQEIRISLQQLLERGAERRRHRNPWGRNSLPSSDGSSEEGDSDGSRTSNISVRSRASGQGNHGDRERRKLQVRMDFPKFAGDEPRVWINRAQQFFGANNIHGSRKVMLASFNLEGEANQWWQWFERANRGHRLSWNQFEKGILLRFGHGDYEDPNESMCRLRQKEGFREFLRDFERLMNCLPNWAEAALLGAFMAGLKEEIAGDVRLFKPRDLQSAIELAKRKDEQLQAGKKLNITSSSTGRMSQLTCNIGSMSSRSTPSGEARKLSWEEMQQRREKNLCFNCDEKYVRGHQCKRVQALLIENEGGIEEEDVGFKEEPHISLNALGGEAGATTMRLTGLLEMSPVEMLIDTRSNLNFINPVLAHQLQIPVTRVKPFTVRIANGDKLECRIKYNSVPIQLQGYNFNVNLFSLPIIGVDIVLGVSWLKGLGPILMDYRAMTMQFSENGRTYHLQGSKKKEVELADMNLIVADWKVGGEEDNKQDDKQVADRQGVMTKKFPETPP